MTQKPKRRGPGSLRGCDQALAHRDFACTCRADIRNRARFWRHAEHFIRIVPGDRVRVELSAYDYQRPYHVSRSLGCLGLAWPAGALLDFIPRLTSARTSLSRSAHPTGSCLLAFSRQTF